MTGQSSKLICMGALALGLAAPVWADTAGTPNLQAEIAALRAEVAELRSSQNESWLTERRAEEVRTLIHEVLSDAETRSTLLQEGLLAGHDGDHFFLGSADGAFLMEVSGQLQFRYIANSQNDRDDEDDSGFQIRRTKLTFEGHVADPRIGYKVQLTADRDSGDVSAEDMILSYDLSDELTVAGGAYKLPFLRQFLMSSARQLAVDRGIVTEAFSLGRADQISLTYQTDAFRLSGAFSDGAESNYTDYNNDGVEYAFTGRVDVKLAGDWNQWKDLVSLPGDGLSAFIGGAVHYQAGDEPTGVFSEDGDLLAWTIDGSVKSNGFSALAAIMGSHFDGDVTGETDAYGVLVEAGYSINERIQPFARWEWADADTPGVSDLQAVTAGFNYFLNGHNAKVTTDVVWVYEGNAGDFGVGTGLGLGNATGGDEDMFALRAQFQLLF